MITDTNRTMLEHEADTLINDLQHHTPHGYSATSPDLTMERVRRLLVAGLKVERELGFEAIR